MYRDSPVYINSIILVHFLVNKNESFYIFLTWPQSSNDPGSEKFHHSQHIPIPDPFLAKIKSRKTNPTPKTYQTRRKIQNPRYKTQSGIDEKLKEQQEHHHSIQIELEELPYMVETDQGEDRRPRGVLLHKNRPPQNQGAKGSMNWKRTT